MVIVFLLFLASLGILMYFDFNNFLNYKFLFKIVSSSLFIVIGLYSYKIFINKYKDSRKLKTYFIFLLLGLIFSFFGDIFLSCYFLSNSFIYGVGAFLLAHVLFILGFNYIKSINSRDLRNFILSFFPIFLFLKYSKLFNYHGDFYLVCIYSAVITFMLIKSLSLLNLYENNKRGALLTVIGTTMFFISDLVLLFLLYCKNSYSILSEVNLFIYYIGQGILALSLSKYHDI